MHLRSLSVLVLICLLVLPGYPWAQALAMGDANRFVKESSALVFPDYLQRSHIINFYEQEVHKSPESPLPLRLVAAQYLKRFREMGDVEDLLRAEQAARSSLAMQPHHNGISSMLLASALLSQHRFQEALDVVTDSQRLVNSEPSVVSLTASIQMELGHYEAAHQLLQTLPDEEGLSGHNAVVARYQELTGNLAGARELLEQTMQQMDLFYTN